jgi:putative ABC transport system permease protein
MPLTTTFIIALTALRRNLMRTVLTTLGMIIGVAAVITIVALGSGAHAAIEEQVMEAGTNVVGRSTTSSNSARARPTPCRRCCWRSRRCRCWSAGSA